jgi:hypothetical protein
MTKSKYFNTSDGPVLINDDGQTVGGQEHFEVDRQTPEIKAAIERGELIKFDSKGKIVYSNKVDVPDASDEDVAGQENLEG